MNIRRELENNGFLVLEGFKPQCGLGEISGDLGKAWSSAKNATAHTISPKDKGASTPNTYSGNFGYGAFPLHTDLAHWRIPPRYLILRCRIGVPHVATLVVDGGDIIRKCGDAVLSLALVQPRRPLRGSTPLLRLYQQREAGYGILRWDELFIKPASARGVRGFDLMKNALAESEPCAIYLRERGDTLIIDNWRMLHGRSPVPKRSKRRIIERMYLEELN